MLPELEQVLNRAQELGAIGRVETLTTVTDKKGKSFPILKYTIGNPDPKAPVLGIIGGVHGLERIGSQVAIAYLNSFSNLVLWDQNTRNSLKEIRIFFIPVVNPTGIYNRTRSNFNGVDLMRNSPVEAENPYFLVGGHRYSNRLPWFRGLKGAAMEPEAQAMVDAVQSEISESVFPLTVDLHSGFGMQDQLWFPYGHTTRPFPHLSHLHALVDLFDRTYPYHFYKIEPQAGNYTIHGDLWDHIYLNFQKQRPGAPYLPLCLEMGSWLWIKKNPLQIFSATGPFNPIIKHRERRILRRHNTLFEFFIKALISRQSWAQLNEEQLHKHSLRAKERWYGKKD